MKKISRKHVFGILYAAEFLILVIIGFFGNSFFAYEAFNSLAADIIYIVFGVLLFLTALIQEVIERKNAVDLGFALAVFGGNLVLFLLYLLVGGLWDLAFAVYQLILAAALAVRYMLIARTGEDAPAADGKQVVCIGLMMIFSMASIMQADFESDMLFAWACIPACVVSIAAFAVTFALMNEVWKECYPRVFVRALCYLGVVSVTFLFGLFGAVPALNSINSAFAGESVSAQYAVLEKKVSAGARQVTVFSVRVEIDGVARWIPLPVTDYHSLEEGDLVFIDYYTGALGIDYYKYGGLSE